MAVTVQMQFESVVTELYEDAGIRLRHRAEIMSRFIRLAFLL